MDFMTEVIGISFLNSMENLELFFAKVEVSPKHP